jgi:(heptosyl)LPS beta-1,4-glucosyltransferase
LTDPTPKPRERLTACLIVQNEQERLPAALESLSFCDRIVVVDGGSSDHTVTIARAAGAQVIESPWPGYAIQRNVALDAADSDWVLEVDADERISPLLRQSIQEMLSAPPPGAAMAVFALRNSFLGGPLGPSAKYPAYRSRLFRRSVYRHDESRAVHEGIELRERPLILDGDLEHELAATVREALVDMWRYARLEGAHLARSSSPLSYAKGIVLRPLAKLAYRTLIDGGWRDGWRGLVKISLDAISDALVWTRVLLGAGRGAGRRALRAPARRAAEDRRAGER